MIKRILRNALLMGCLLAVVSYTGMEAEELITVQLTETNEAFANPMKGFRPTRFIQDDTFPQGEYATVAKQYIKYTDLEMSPEDTAQKIIDWSNQAWAGIEKRNLKVIPRVVIVYPNGPDGGTDGYWPEGVDHSHMALRWIEEAFIDRLCAFAAKLGEAWDNDPRVAAIEMGLWGKWGEHHVWPLDLPGGSDRIPRQVQDPLGDAFARAFPNKKVMVRYALTFKDYDFGFFWDSFALPNDRVSALLMIERDSWRTQMMSGEVAYDWGDQRAVGGSPDGTLASDACTDHVIDWIRQTHTSSLGWIADYSQDREDLAANAARIQKALGYRYVLNTATYPQTVQPGEQLPLRFEINNVGSAPFYYPWPVEVSLLNTEQEPVWQAVMDVDIRNWLPDETHTVIEAFVLPQNLPAGTYTLALAVLDPAGNVPSLRFANAQYYTGGRTPLGTIGIGQAPDLTETGPYDSLYADRSLYYIVE
ncbi:MAG: DUF4832 domain-containing protein [Clostridia bacterium]|nr:DUF4832 domain-containing protein [Clostridia bacterium]